ncbi:hypothetical protein Tco_0994221, partial [Tanacetum coccineum]
VNSTEPNAPVYNVDNTVVGNYEPSHQHVSTRIQCGYSTTTNSVLRVVRNPIASSFAVYNELRGRANSRDTVLTGSAALPTNLSYAI